MGRISPKIWCHQKPEVTSSKFILPRIPSSWVLLDTSQRLDLKKYLVYSFNSYRFRGIVLFFNRKWRFREVLTLFILLWLYRKFIQLKFNAFSKARTLAFVLLRGGGNWRTWEKPPILDGQPRSCNMPYMCTAANLVMWPGPFEQAFVSPSQEGST